MCDAACAKRLLVLFNVIFFIGGAGVLGIGIWMKVDPMIVNYLQVVNISQSDPLVDHAAWLFIVVGGVAFIVGTIGCCGALRENQGLLFVYAFLLLVVMAAEITGAVLALIYRGKVETALQKHMTEQVKENYVAGSGTQDAWDYLQEDLLCCGGSNFTDYENSKWWNATMKNSTGLHDVVPKSCCKGTLPEELVKCQDDARKKDMNSESFYHTGCYDALHSWFSQQTLILMIIGFAVGGIQVFGFVAACCLRNALKTKNYKA